LKKKQTNKTGYAVIQREINRKQLKTKENKKKKGKQVKHTD